ncbi:hypothetical protein XENOCAPTIV_015623, partial [Xenoophorus captivus]
YNKGESVGLDPLGSGRMGFPGSLTDCSGRRPSMENILGGTPASAAALRLAQRQRESDEENLKEECSSTESTHQEHEDSSSAGRSELAYLEDERVRVLARIDELKTRLTELEQQLQESEQEAEMERALLQGETQAELNQIEAETDVVSQLQRKLEELESAIQREKDKDGETLEAGTKKFEDLEFQQLERESSLEEERETISQQLLQEKAEYHSSVAKRKEKVSALENQANQLGQQASQECERLAKDRTLTLQMLQKEKERLSALEKRYHCLTGGMSFPKSSTTMREEALHVSDAELLLGDDRSSQTSLCGASPSFLYPSPLCQLFPSRPTEEYVKLSDVYKMYSSKSGSHRHAFAVDAALAGAAE